MNARGDKWIKAALVACLLLLGYVLYTWAASYERVAICFSRGKVYLLTTSYAGNIHWLLDEGRPNDPVSGRIEGLRTNSRSQRQWLGLDYVDSEVATAYGISLLYVALIPLCGATWFAWLLRRRRRRERLGLCLGCGYDLRESGGRCPECGREVPAGHGGRA